MNSCSKAMVVDTSQAPIPSNAFIGGIKKVNTKPVRHVVNTHGHSDHTSGNQFFMQAFKPEIIAHEKAREMTISTGAGRNPTGGGPNWLAAPGVAVGNERYFKTPATTTIPTSVMTVYYGSLKIELHAMDPAHTLGDVIVYVPQQKIVFGGDICIFEVGPLGGGSGLGTIRALEWILSVDPDGVVPGHGPVGAKKNVKRNSNISRPSVMR
jgi:cyclase